MELIGLPHKNVNNEYVVIEGDWAKSFRLSLGFLNSEYDKNKINNTITEGNNVLEIINKLSEIKIRDKSGLYIGSRMGRPEKQK